MATVKKSRVTVDIDAQIVLVLSEEEAHALDGIFGYNVEAFLRVFYERMGRAYVEPYEAGVRSLHNTIRSVLSKPRSRSLKAMTPTPPPGFRLLSDGVIKGMPGVEGLGERLKCVREIRRLTQAELATKLEVPPAEVSHFETGQRLPGAKNLRKLCIALNVSADYLLDTQ